MTIAFDFDHTITADPAAMIAAMRLFRNAGHVVIVATLRDRWETDAVDRLLKDEFPVVYTGRKTKNPECQKAGYTVNVWVDDMPEFCRDTVLFTIKDEEL